MPFMAGGPTEKLTLLSLRIRRGYVITFALAVALTLGALLERWGITTTFPANATEDFRLMGEAWSIIDRNYVDRAAVRPINMAHGAINGMVESLGDTGHSVFLDRTQARKAGAAMQGKMIGIGIEIHSQDHQPVVIAPIDGSPAQLAGVRAGDVILAVDGHPVAGLSLSQVTARIAGEAGQSIGLTVKNPRDNAIREVKIVRASITVNNVSWQELPGTSLAHLRVALFSEGAANDLRTALEKIEQRHLSGIILDLRNNPGGALDEAISVASQFLKSGVVLWEKDARANLTPVPVRPGGIATVVPLVVLVNNGSASDSEIVAGALHDAQRAKLIGETTFGTGTVLNQFALSDGSALLLAVEEWLTPNKRSFWHKGIEPDIRVALPPRITPLRPTTERDLTRAQLDASGDAQLLRAIEFLGGK